MARFNFRDQPNWAGRTSAQVMDSNKAKRLYDKYGVTADGNYVEKESANSNFSEVEGILYVASAAFTLVFATIFSALPSYFG